MVQPFTAHAWPLTLTGLLAVHATPLCDSIVSREEFIRHGDHWATGSTLPWYPRELTWGLYMDSVATGLHQGWKLARWRGGWRKLERWRGGWRPVCPAPALPLAMVTTDPQNPMDFTFKQARHNSSVYSYNLVLLTIKHRSCKQLSKKYLMSETLNELF